MKAGWQTLTIDDVCVVVNGGTPKTGVSSYWGGPHMWITPAEMGGLPSPYVSETARRLTDDGLNATNLLPPNSVILSSRAPIGHLVINSVPMGTNQGCKGLVPKPMLDTKYLYYYLSSVVDLLNELGTGTTFKELSGTNLKRVPIPLPPLDEQRRIVSILDEAFEAIATATANAKKKIADAKEIFDSYARVAFASGADWSYATLGELCELFVDSAHRTPKYQDVGFPALRPRDVVNGVLNLNDAACVSQEEFEIQSKRHRPAGGDIVYSRELSFGWAAMLPEAPAVCLSQGMCLFRPKPCLRRDYLLYVLNGPIGRAQASRAAVGTAHPHINLGDIKSYRIPVPPVPDQVRIVEKLDTMRALVGDLVATETRRGDCLGLLEQSLLKRAFSGALAREVTNVFPFPKTIPNITTTDLHAGVLAIAYQKHLDRDRQGTFQHVKAEKIAHMVEALAGVELGRKPVKDAAGPNDFRHLQQVQHRAERANFFSFKQGNGGYQFTKKLGFDRLVERTRTALGDDLPAVEKVVDIMVPMDFRQAEIFATIYAAWNNMLLDGSDISDEAIVRAARDEWHSEKLKIPSDRFFDALKWMRENGFIPKGIGKKVLERSVA